MADDRNKDKDGSDDSSEGGSGSSSNGKFNENSKEVTDKTAEIEKIIDNYFYFDQDEEKREESYYDGIMKGLDDPYSVYYTKEEYEKNGRKPYRIFELNRNRNSCFSSHPDIF